MDSGYRVGDLDIGSRVRGLRSVWFLGLGWFMVPNNRDRKPDLSRVCWMLVPTNSETIVQGSKP